MQQISADIRYREGGFVEAIFLFWLKKIKKKRKLPYRFTLLHVISTVISINVRSLLFSVIDSCQQETKSQQKQKTDSPNLAQGFMISETNTDLCIFVS